MSRRQAHTPVIGHPFQPLDNVRADHLHQAHQTDHPQRNENGCSFEGVKLHNKNVHKKTRATQGCSGFSNFKRIAPWAITGSHLAIPSPISSLVTALISTLISLVTLMSRT